MFELGKAGMTDCFSALYRHWCTVTHKNKRKQILLRSSKYESKWSIINVFHVAYAADHLMRNKTKGFAQLKD